MQLDKNKVADAICVLQELGVNLEDVAEQAVQQAVKKAMNAIDKPSLDRVARTRQSVARNVKILLANYNMLKACRDNAVYDLVTLVGDDAIDDLGLPKDLEERYSAIDDLMRRTISKHDVRVSSIEKAAARTHLLIEDLETALNDYHSRCVNSKRVSDRRRWYVLEAHWLKDPPKSTDIIAREMHFDQRTIQKDLKRAVDDITVLLFGSEVIRGIGADL